MGLTDALRQQGFRPSENVDEDFPPIAGEYKAVVKAIRPEQTDGMKDRYLAQFKIVQTLSGDMADNRVLLRSYRIGGVKFDKSAVTEQEAVEAIKAMANDAMTCGVALDLSSDEALEDSLAGWLDKECYLRAWHFSPKDEPERKIQQFKVKREKDLRKASQDGAAGKTAQAPF